jgi:hypothetical protein
MAPFTRSWTATTDEHHGKRERDEEKRKQSGKVTKSFSAGCSFSFVLSLAGGKMKGRWESSQQRLISNCLPHVFFFYLLAEAASDRLAFILVCERVCVYVSVVVVVSPRCFVVLAVRRLEKGRAAWIHKTTWWASLPFLLSLSPLSCFGSRR